MRGILFRLMKVNANYYSFLSGILIAVSINLYTDIFSGDEIPTRWRVLLASAIATLLSSFLWILISWKLDPMQKLALLDSPKNINPDKTLMALIAGKEHFLATYFIFAILSAVFGLMILLIY